MACRAASTFCLLITAGVAGCTGSPARLEVDLGPARDPLVVGDLAISLTIAQNGRTVSSADQPLDWAGGSATASFDYRGLDDSAPADFRVVVTWSSHGNRTLLVAEKRVAGSELGATVTIDATSVTERPDSDGDLHGDLAEALGGTDPDDPTVWPSAEWTILPAPTTDSLDAVIVFNGNIVTVSSTGRLYVYGSGGTWSEDNGFAAALGGTPPTGPAPAYALGRANPGGGADTDLYVTGPSGLLMHSDASGSWTKIAAGTTANLHGVATTGNYVNLYVWVVGDGGTLLTNTVNDPLAFTSSTVQVNGAAVAADLLRMSVGGATGVIGGSGPTLYHRPNLGAWVADTITPAPSTAALLLGVVQLDSADMLAIESSGRVLSAYIPTPTSSVAWSTTYTLRAAALGIAAIAGDVFVVGASGAAAVRGAASGSWSESDTGVSRDLTDVAGSASPLTIVAVGARGTVLKYTGP